MIISMTGFGRGEATGEGLAVTVEIRSVNSRYLEVSSRLPKELSHREQDVRELIRTGLSRGKVNLTLNITRSAELGNVFEVDEMVVAQFKDALNAIRKAAKIKETVTLTHLLAFKDDMIRRSTAEDQQDQEWLVVKAAITDALSNLNTMRNNEGRELAKDLLRRVDSIDRHVNSVEKLSREQVPNERKRLRERIARLFENEEIDEQRLELEIVLMADKLDVTEECVRWRAHSKFFRETIKDSQPSGRRMNFLLQEMLREINTIGSKSSDPRIARSVVEAKEELERIREQAQNIE